MSDGLSERVLRAVSLIPPGRVVSYGDVAELVGCSARQVGQIMATRGGSTPWWRVTNATGRLPERLMDEARARWAEEGVGFSPNTGACRVQAFRADLAAWADAWEDAASANG